MHQVRKCMGPVVKTRVLAQLCTGVGIHSISCPQVASRTNNKYSHDCCCHLPLILHDVHSLAMWSNAAANFLIIAKVPLRSSMTLYVGGRMSPRFEYPSSRVSSCLGAAQ